MHPLDDEFAVADGFSSFHEMADWFDITHGLPFVGVLIEIMIARHQHEHGAINAREHPGTRQLCATCDEPTERCEEDAIYTEEGDGPLCLECWHKTPEYLLENS
jgi:hypothetical protein